MTASATPETPSSSAAVLDDHGYVLADGEWHTPKQLNARRDVDTSVYTLQKWMAAGQLHGHKHNGRWRTKKTVYDGCVQNLDIHAQVRICGCSQLAAVPSPRRRGT